MLKYHKSNFELQASKPDAKNCSRTKSAFSETLKRKAVLSNAYPIHLVNTKIEVLSSFALRDRKIFSCCKSSIKKVNSVNSLAAVIAEKAAQKGATAAILWDLCLPTA